MNKCRRLTGNCWRSRLSGGCGAGVEQSASTDQGSLVAIVFPAVEKTHLFLITVYHRFLKPDM